MKRPPFDLLVVLALAVWLAFAWGCERKTRRPEWVVNEQGDTLGVAIPLDSLRFVWRIGSGVPDTASTDACVGCDTTEAIALAWWLR